VAALDAVCIPPGGVSVTRSHLFGVGAYLRPRSTVLVRGCTPLPRQYGGERNASGGVRGAAVWPHPRQQ
jgi:hypothetical protein